MFSCSSSPLELELLSSSSWDDHVFGEFGGASSSFPCVMFPGCALVFVGAGGGGALLLLFSAVFIACAIALPSVLRCACRRSSVSLLVFDPVLLLSFLLPEVPKVPGQFISRLSEFFSQFCYPVVLLFFFLCSPASFSCWGFLGALREVFLFLLLSILLRLFRFFSPLFSPLSVLEILLLFLVFSVGFS